MKDIKVSVLVPICNVEKYLRECLDSLIYQTMDELQIICIDDGSSDSSPSIIEEYRLRDPRIEVITKPNSGYGDSMNKGLERARGEYVGIVESDDFAELDMFESLYALAKKHDADVVKSNFRRHTKERHPSRDTLVNNLRDCRFNVTFRPADEPSVMRGSLAIWSGLYRKKHLDDNGVRFLPTPGASFQDTSFSHKAIASAERMVVTDKAYLHYRVDNAASSVKSTKKVLFICEEYRETWRFIHERPQLWEALKMHVPRLQFDGYNWNLNRLDPAIRHEFYERFVSEFKQLEGAGLLAPECFDEDRWGKLSAMLDNPEGYFQETYGEKPLTDEDPASETASPDGEADEPCFVEESAKPTAIRESSLDTCLASIIAPVHVLDDKAFAWAKSLCKAAANDAEIVFLAVSREAAMLEAFDEETRDDARITLATLPEECEGEAFSFGLELAKGAFVAFANQGESPAFARVAPSLAQRAVRSGAQLAGARMVIPAEGEPETESFADDTPFEVTLKCPRDFARDAFAFGPYRFTYHRSLFEGGILALPQGAWMDDTLLLSTCLLGAPAPKPLRTTTATCKAVKTAPDWNLPQAKGAANCIANAFSYAISHDMNELYTLLVRRVESEYCRCFVNHANDLGIRANLLSIQSGLDQSCMVAGHVPDMLKALAALKKPLPKPKPDVAIVRAAKKAAKSKPYAAARGIAKKLRS